MTSHYSKQIIIQVTHETASHRYVDHLKVAFEEQHGVGSCYVLKLSVSNSSSLDEVISRELTGFHIDPQDRLRIYIIGHGKPGIDYIQGYDVQDGQLHILKYTSHELSHIIKKMLSTINRALHLPVTISHISCYGASDDARLFSTKKSFAENLHNHLAQLNIFAEITARNKRIMMNMFSKHKYILPDYDKSLFASLNLITKIGSIIKFLLVLWFSSIRDFFKRCKINNPSDSSNLFKKNIIYKLHCCNILSYFFSYFRKLRIEAWQQYMVSKHFSPLDDNHSDLQSLEKNIFFSHHPATTKKLFTYQPDELGRPTRIIFSDAYSSNAAQSREEYLTREYYQNNIRNRI